MPPRRADKNEDAASSKEVAADGFEITLTWNEYVDLDLHMFAPDGTHICFQCPKAHNISLSEDRVPGHSAGDDDEAMTWGSTPSERLTCPQLQLKGRYLVEVWNMGNMERSEPPPSESCRFRLEFRLGGKVHDVVDGFLGWKELRQRALEFDATLPSSSGDEGEKTAASFAVLPGDDSVKSIDKELLSLPSKKAPNDGLPDVSPAAMKTRMAKKSKAKAAKGIMLPPNRQTKIVVEHSNGKKPTAKPAKKATSKGRATKSASKRAKKS
jgi:hypothetical protein